MKRVLLSIGIVGLCFAANADSWKIQNLTNVPFNIQLGNETACGVSGGTFQILPQKTGKIQENWNGTNIACNFEVFGFPQGAYSEEGFTVLGSLSENIRKNWNCTQQLGYYSCYYQDPEESHPGYSVIVNNENITITNCTECEIAH